MTLTSLLVRDEVVPAPGIEEALRRQVLWGGDLETALLELGAAPENVLASYRAALFGVPPARVEDVMSAPPEAIARVPVQLAIEHRLVPIALQGDSLVVAVYEPSSEAVVEQLRLQLGVRLAPRVACEVRIAAAQARYFGVELAPRFARLLERMRARDPGRLVVVEPASIPRLSGSARESDLGDALGSPEGGVRPSSAPDLDARSRGRTGMGSTPPASTGRRYDSTLRPGPGALRLMRGPLTLADGERSLARASGRDPILALLLSFARQFFDYTAVFVVQDDAAEGLEAWGVGASTAEVRALRIPLDGPSVFAEARRTLAPQVRELGRSEIERDVARALRRALPSTGFVLPVAIRQRVVLLVYGDRDGEDFDLGAVMELVRFGVRVAEALERLIVRRKTLPPGEPSPDAPPPAEGSSRPPGRLASEAAGASDASAWVSPDAAPTEVLGIARREPPPPPVVGALAELELVEAELVAAIAEAERRAAEEDPELIVDSSDDQDLEGLWEDEPQLR